MERGSDKHSARQDDALAHEVEGMVRSGHSTHAEEWKDPEPSGEDQPSVSLDPEGALVGGTPDGMTSADVDGRSELASYLGRHAFPSSAEQVRQTAAANEAPDRILDRLAGLPADRGYQNVQEVWTDLGGGAEEHRS